MPTIAARSAGLPSSPPRPDTVLTAPAPTIRVRVEPEVAHLANPLVAVGRLLASEAGAFAHLSGDERCFDVAVALADDDPVTAADAERWIRWAVHNAGIRGRVRRT